MKNYKTIFMGNPEISIPSLIKLIEMTNCVAVYTGQDKVKGRGKKILPTPVKKTSVEYSIPVQQPETFKNTDIIRKLEEYEPDFILVMAYGFILPKKVLDIPRIAPINLHGSILPKYRGASPIHQALLNRDKKTGVTAQYMVKRMDAGDILHIEELDILPDDNYLTLSQKLADLSSVCLEKVLIKYHNGEIKPIPQDENKASYCSKINAEDGHIDWSKSCEKIIGEIKAYYSWPHSYTYYNGDKLIIKDAKYKSNQNVASEGEIIKADKTGLDIQTGDGILSIIEIQQEKRKPLYYKDFLNGYKLEIGKKFS
jgi:methionyl-tRNA formyltransferase